MGNLNIDAAFFLQYLFNPPAIFWWGLWITIWVSFVSMVLGICVGFGVALARMSKYRWLREWARFYVWFWRGTPLLVQLVLIYTGIAASGIYMYPDLVIGPVKISGAVQAAIIALSLNEGAYMAEIFRAALSAIDKGQHDAARAIGMRPAAAMRWIILPQAARIVLPPLGNEITLMIKSTSLLAVIGIREMFGTLQSLNAATFRTFELFTIAAIWYLLLTSLVALGQRAIEARLSRHEWPLASTPDIDKKRSLFGLRR
ncbi:amino acid ABC transporter permease [Rhodoligotrophos ferricapiens]|uniref:amino acid ABC transporter permease n=1 Tax=Rhodoligotrophos ferricapiens TaxID=3069264 RepID=UPI00315DC2EE